MCDVDAPESSVAEMAFVSTGVKLFVGLQRGCETCGRYGRQVGQIRVTRAAIATPDTTSPGAEKQHPWHGAPAAAPGHRTAVVRRSTKETQVNVYVNLDGSGYCAVDTGVAFLDHMLAQLSAHGLIDLAVQARGDTWIDDHHTNEDVGITLGMAIAKALGDKRGIRRFGNFSAPLDEALVEVVMDFSGRAFLSYDLTMLTEKVGTYDTQLVKEFYAAVAGNAQITLHVMQKAGENSHHIIEASFKAFARALRIAVEMDPRRGDKVPSSKGTLTDSAALSNSFE